MWLASLVTATLRRGGHRQCEWAGREEGISGDQEKKASTLWAEVACCVLGVSFQGPESAFLMNLLLSGVIAELKSCRNVCKEEFLSF